MKGEIKMPYKKGVEKIPHIIKEAISENKDVVFLIKTKEKEFRRITENVAFVEHLEKGQEDEMAKLTLRFANNTVVETIAYIDKMIEENCFISLWGYFDTFNDKVCFYCKGGCQRILSRLDEMEIINVEYPYRMGIAELSEVKILDAYESTSNIEQIEDSDIYYIKGKNKNTTNGEENVINTKLPRLRIELTHPASFNVLPTYSLVTSPQ